MFEGDDLEPCSVSSVESGHSGEQERCFGRFATGFQCGDSDSRRAGNSKTHARVRFDLGETSVAATAASRHEEAIEACSRVPVFQEEEAGETSKAEGRKEEDGRYGQGLVARQRNGIHTAWRLQEPNCNNGNPATTPTVHTSSSSITSATPSTRWESVSADQLISLTTPSPPQQQEQFEQQPPVRLFLRRTRATSLSTSATNTMGGSVRAAAATGALTGSRARRIAVGSDVDSRAFPLPWAGRRSPMGNKEIGVQLSRGGRSGEEHSRKGRSKVLTPPPHGDGWATPSPAARPEHQQQRRGLISSTRGPPLRHLATSKSPNTIRNRRHDDNFPPPACISSPSVRQNLARAARKSKVGTKADPVTLYRQRQELEQARIKNAVARNRKEAGRERRTSDGLAWGSGRVAGMGTVVGGRTRAAGSVVSRVGISLR